MNGKTHLVIAIFDNEIKGSKVTQTGKSMTTGQWAARTEGFKIGNDFLAPVLYPDKDAIYNMRMWLTILGFEVNGTETMGDWSSEVPKIDAVKVGAFVTEFDEFKGRPHAVDAKNGTIFEFELL